MTSKIKWSTLRRHLSVVVRGIACMALGAAILCGYLEWNDPVFRQSWGELDGNLILVFWLLLIADAYLRPRKPHAPSSFRLSPDYSGGTVILLTGITAATAIWWQQADDNSYLIPGLIVIAAIAGAIAAWRFAKVHEAEIGEARFKG